MWLPAQAHDHKVVRTLHRTITLPSRERVPIDLEIGYTQHGTITTEDQKNYYVLNRLWQLAGCSDEYVPFSLRGIAKIGKRRLYKKKRQPKPGHETAPKWGSSVVVALTHSLRRLRQTPLTWRRAFYKSPSEQWVDMEEFNLLEDLRIVTRVKDGHVTTAAGYFRFNRGIRESHRASHNKPVQLEVVVGFRGGIAQVLYGHYDLVMSDKVRYERKSKALFEDLGLTGASYRHAANRKQKLVQAHKELAGSLLTTGSISRADVVRTKDGKDYKVVVEKALLLPEGQNDAKPQPPVDQKPIPVPDSANQIRDHAEDLVAHFYQVFHGVTPNKQDIRTKELEQAEALVAQYGQKVARYIIDFSRGAAEETKYSPQTLGGIMQYTARAVAQHQASKRAEQRHQLEEEEARLRIKYRDYQEQELERYIAEQPEQFQELVEQRTVRNLEDLKDYKNLSEETKRQSATSSAERWVRSSIADRICLSFEEWERDQANLSQPSAEETSGPQSYEKSAPETPLNEPPDSAEGDRGSK